jgi:phosphatidylinositol-3-phosphatase
MPLAIPREYMNRPFTTLVLFLACIMPFGCGGVSHNSTPAPPVPGMDHVFLVVLENHGFGEVIGNPAMPYLNSLANSNGLAVAYFANAHPSIPNYFVLTTGNPETFDDSFAGTVSDDNLVRALTGAGKSWKAYIESLPSTGYTGPSVGTYLRRHNPFSFLSDVDQSSAQMANMVPFSQFSADLGSGNLANFVYLLPNSQDDAHDCPGGAPTCDDNVKLAAADNWLHANIDPLIKSPNFGNSVLIITFDEAQSTDFTDGGGQVATVLVGPHVRPGFRSNVAFQHQSTLRLILDALKVSDMPGASGGAQSMGGFFQ